MLNEKAAPSPSTVFTALSTVIKKIKARQFQRIGLWTGLFAVICFALAALTFRWELFAPPPTEALNWTLAGSIFFTISLLCLRPHFTQFVVARTAPKQISVNWIMVTLALLLLFTVAYVNHVDMNDGSNAKTFQLNQHIQFALMVAGSLGLMLGFGGFLKSKPLFTTQSSEPPRIGWVIVGVVELCLLLLVQILFSVDVATILNVVGVMAGILLIVYGAGLVGKVNFNGFNLSWPKVQITPHMIALAVIVGIGLFLRLWQLDTAVHVTVDELHFIYGAVNLRNLPNQQLLMPIDTTATFSHMYPYLQNLVTGIFGSDLFAMRVPSAIIGTLTILAIYFFVREGLDKKTALIAAALLAIFPPHIHFSRSAMNNIVDMLPGVMALAFLIRGLKHNSQRSYALAGVCFGWTSFFYEGGRLVFVGLLVAYLLFILITQRPWSHLRNWLVFIVCAVAIGGTYYYTMTKPGPYSFSMRLLDAGTPVWQRYRELYESTHSIVPVVEQYLPSLIAPFAHIVYTPDPSRIYYGGQIALLQRFLVPFFLLGVFIALLVFRRFGALLVGWVLLTGLGASLVFGSGWTVRLLVYVVPVITIIAIGLRYTFEMLAETFIALSTADQQVDRAALLTRTGIVLSALVVVFIVAGGAYQLHYYFTTHLEWHNRYTRQFRFDFLDAFYRAIDIDPDSHLVFVVSPDPEEFEPLKGFIMEDLDIWIRFKHIQLTLEVIDSAALTPEKMVELADWHRDHALIFAVEPPEYRTDRYGNALDAPVAMVANQQAHTLIVNSFPDARGQIRSQYTSVPTFQQYQLLVVPPVIDPNMPLHAVTFPAPAPETAAVVVINAPAQAEQCVNVVGESAASSYVRFNVPPSGNWMVHTQPLSFYLSQKLDEVGIQAFPIHEYTTISGAIGPGIKEASPDYMQSVIYQGLMASHCRVTVMMPWLSDLTAPMQSGEQSAAQYADRMTKLIYDLLMATPDSRILLVKFYPAEFSPAVQETDGGVTGNNIALYNQQLQKICESDNPDWQKVVCIDPKIVFDKSDRQYVLTRLTYQEIQADLAPDQTMSVADAYFADHPEQTELQGDGIHLSQDGKIALSQYIADHIRDIITR